MVSFKIEEEIRKFESYVELCFGFGELPGECAALAIPDLREGVRSGRIDADYAVKSLSSSRETDRDEAKRLKTKATAENTHVFTVTDEWIEARRAEGAARVLMPHATSFEQSVEVTDYPYGRLRTKMRFWIEVATRGSAKGDYRLVQRSLDPKRNIWNKPKDSTYRSFGVCFVDTSNGHVEWATYNTLYGLTDLIQFESLGLVAQMPEEMLSRHRAKAGQAWRVCGESGQRYTEIMKRLAIAGNASEWRLLEANPATILDELYPSKTDRPYESDFLPCLNYVRALRHEYRPA